MCVCVCVCRCAGEVVTEMLYIVEECNPDEAEMRLLMRGMCHTFEFSVKWLAHILLFPLRVSLLCGVLWTASSC